MVTTASARPPWKTASERATSDAHRPWTCFGSRPLARSTTASRPSSGDCCSTPRRSSRTRSRPSRPPRLSRGYDYTDLALLTDGLRSEREQGITIDVAYRYFATPNRKFIIADTPGHVQYTRNMVTGASTADLGLVLVDARQGLTEQSRRHAVILSLLRVPHLVLCINKMDLVDYSQERYNEIHEEFTSFATKLSIPDLTIIPISALHGDNVVTRSENMDWYDGPSLLHHLENVHVASDRDLVDTRFPVQYVVRPKSDDYHDYRGYAGRVAGGVLKPGDDVLVLPSGMTSKISAIDLFDKELDEAFPPMSVTVRLEDDVDVSRGDMICRPQNAPDAEPGHRRDDLLDVDGSAASASEAGDQAHDPDGAHDGQGRAVPARRQLAAPRSRDQGARRSTRSAGCSCGRRCRCCATRTRRTARRAGSSSSTKRQA